MRSVGFSETGAEIEHLAWNIIQNKQKKHGFPFDLKKAEMLYADLREREEKLKEEIYELWPPKLEVVAEYSKATKKDGTPTANYERHLSEYPKIERRGQGYVAYDWVSFNLGSPTQRIQKLLELGWKPANKTPKGNPKVDEDELLAFAEESGKPEVAALAKWIVVNSRANMIRTWMNAYNPETKAIHGSLYIASTLRYRHSNPNSANIPAVRVGDNGPLFGEEGAWTWECRDLFYSGEDDDFILVGIDAQGIQLRILAQYLNNSGFTEAILSEDPHSANQEMMGLPSRALTKTITYATLMGAGDARVAVTAGISKKEAKRVKGLFFEAVPELPGLIKKLQFELERTGRITLCDGSKILVSSDHMVIPYLLQGDESRIMKKTLILIDEEVRKRKWTKDVFYCANVHDELQIKVRKVILDEFLKVSLLCFERAGEFFEYSVPIEGSAAIGKTWASTH